MGYQALAERIAEIETTINPQMLSRDALCIMKALRDVAEEIYMLRIGDKEE